MGDIMALNGLFIFLYLNGHLIVHTYDRSWLFFLFILNASWLIIVFYTNPYRINRVTHLIKLINSSGYSVFQHFLITSTTIYLLDFILVHKWGLFIVYLTYLIILLAWRLSLYSFLSFYRSKGYNFRNVVIIGYGSVAKHLEVFFSLHPEYGYNFIGYFDDTSKNQRILGDINSAKSSLQLNKYMIDEVYCCLPYVKYGQIKQIIDLCEDRLIKVKLITDFRAFSFKGLELTVIRGIPQRESH